MKKAILVVDDDNDIRVTLAELLELEGFDVLTASNGEEALKAIRSTESRKPIHLVLLDLMMPVMNGKEFLSVQRNDPDLSQLPVILLSAGSRPTDLPSNLTFLKKPLDAEHLLSVIRQYV